MTAKFLKLICALLIIGVTSSCRDETFLADFNDNSDGLPVEIEVSIDRGYTTRGLIEDSKISFSNNELLHIRAEYDCEDPNSGAKSTVIQYGVVKYSGNGKWAFYSDDTKLSWPRSAKSGHFTAYYIYGSTGVLSANTMPPTLLSDYKVGQDPLSGVAEFVEYGHTVSFNMKHIFTHLTLTQISTEIADEMYFTIPEDEPDYQTLNNAFLVEFDESTKEFTGKFVRLPSDNYKDNNGDGRVFISAKTETYEDEDSEMRDRISLFLQPGAYHKFDLLYPRSRTETTRYLNYNRDLAVLTGERGLLENTFYEFSILKSLGVYIQEDPDNEWDESEPVIILDVEAFIKAINSGEEYSQVDPETGEIVIILEPSSNGTTLLRNVDFNYHYYDIIDGSFLPDLSLTFDGNYHYIQHISCPLFNENHGIITNLGISDAKTPDGKPLQSNENFVSEKGGTADFSRNGMLCRMNMGTIANVHINNVDMTVEIKTTGSTFEESSQEAHNVAMVVGSNRGSLTGLNIAGSLSLTVQNEPSTTILPTVAVGSIAGQNLGTLSGVSPIEKEGYDSPTYTIMNKCESTSGVYLVGGVAGSNTGNIFDILMSSIEVDGSQSTGVESLMGGIAGNMPLSTSGAPCIDGCIIRGNVIAGPSYSMININSNSYTGGVVGLLNIQGKISNSSVSVGVTGTSEYDEKVNYATGGAFGRIESTLADSEGGINTLACFGSTLYGVKNVGNFAGIAPIGFTWDDHYSGNNLNIKQFAGKPNIATYQ